MSRSAGSAIVIASAVVAVVLVAMMPRTAEARPSHLLSRPKRVSDQRLAELETLIALKNMRGQLVTVPVGFGKVDPKKIGRKRRSSTESNLQELRRLLRSVVAGDNELSPRERSRFARIFARWAEQQQQLQQEDEEAAAAAAADDRGEDEGLLNLL